MVILVHGAPIFTAISRKVIDVPEWTAFGSAAVDLFFVISGFIIASVLKKEQSAFNFLYRRAVRILPSYWLFTLLLILATKLLDPTKEIDTVQFIFSFLVLPQTNFPILFVGWSLEHELIFYVLVSILVFFNISNFLYIFLTGICLVSLCWHVIFPALNNSFVIWDYHLFSLYHFDFLFGVLVYRNRHSVGYISPAIKVALSLLMYAVTANIILALYGDGHLPTQPEGIIGLVRVIAFGGISSMLLLGLIQIELRPNSGRIFSRLDLAINLGDASYSIYLIHPLIIAAAAIILEKVRVFDILTWPIFAAVFILCCVLSVIWHRTFDSTFIRKLTFS